MEKEEKKKGFSISLVIPAYNEENRILPVLQNYLSFFKKNYSGFEIIVVCNNCSDRTPEVVSGLSKKEKFLFCMNFPQKIGKGGAVIEGFKKARKEIIGFVDADASTSPEEFHKIISAINGFDCAIGSRAMKESVIPVKQPFSRRIMGFVFRNLVNLMFGLGIRDTQCGAKAFKREAIKKVLPLLELKGWEFDVDLLWKTKKVGYKIKEVAIKWVDDKRSNVKFFDPFKMLFGLFRLRFS